MNPIQGGFTEVYVVTGRVIDALGNPAARGEVVVELEQPGIRAAPLRAATDCFGTFLTSFDLKEVKPEGKVTVTLKGQGAPDATATAKLDAFYRRSDVNLRYQGKWEGACPEQTQLWSHRVSLTGRIVNRTDAYEENGVKYQSKPYDGRMRAYFWESNQSAVCTPAATNTGGCDPNAVGVDERGDFRYSWLFEGPLDVRSDQRVEVVLGNKSYNFTVDPEWRVATAAIEATGQGAPAPAPTPGAPLALLAMGVAAAALLARRRRT